MIKYGKGTYRQSVKVYVTFVKRVDVYIKDVPTDCGEDGRGEFINPPDDEDIDTAVWEQVEIPSIDGWEEEEVVWDKD